MTGVPDRLARAFLARPAPEVAADLVGALLVRADERLVARIAEAEAYMRHDPACHAHRGRTARNEPLWGPAGHAYVYFSYGMHWCLNVSTGAPGDAQGCLLRAAEPLAGLAVFRSRRGGQVRDRDLLRGPARLAQAFGFDRTWNG
ncbi:MAG: DNA-3-methyladenine glycosylase, partial [Actinomycetota bacterium]|nr:DNA-3-methyladenine glycosylase [Actinomycetota bacterium]